MKIFSRKQNLNHLQCRVQIAVFCTGVWCCLSFVQAEDPRDVLPPEEWQLVDAYYCSQAMCQLGGEFWQKFFPPLAGTLMANQSNDGSWDVEADNNGDYFGRTYTTSLAVLALTPAYQLLPINQR